MASVDRRGMLIAAGAIVIGAGIAVTTLATGPAHAQGAGSIRR